MVKDVITILIITFLQSLKNQRSSPPTRIKLDGIMTTNIKGVEVQKILSSLFSLMLLWALGRKSVVPVWNFPGPPALILGRDSSRDHTEAGCADFPSLHPHGLWSWSTPMFLPTLSPKMELNEFIFLLLWSSSDFASVNLLKCSCFSY